MLEETHFRLVFLQNCYDTFHLRAAVTWLPRSMRRSLLPAHFCSRAVSLSFDGRLWSGRGSASVAEVLTRSSAELSFNQSARTRRRSPRLHCEGHKELSGMVRPADVYCSGEFYRAEQSANKSQIRGSRSWTLSETLIPLRA